MVTQVPMTFIDILGNLSGIFSGILAFAFDTVSGHSGLSGWQWLFLVEGLITIVLGTAVYFLLPDFPPTAKWLTDKEKAVIQARLPANAPRAEETNFNWREIADALGDKRLWLFTLIWATFTVGASGVRFYQPTVGTVPRPLYPPGVFAVIPACYGVLVAYPSNGAVYAATLVGNASAAAFFPLMWPWRVQTTSRATGSAFSIGFVNSHGQVGGAIGPRIFRSTYAPRYRTSFAAAMALVGCCAIITCVAWWATRQTEADTRQLKRARVQAERDGLAVLDDVVDRDLSRGKNHDEEST
ncbi:putative transporter [Colletotrichum spinosum]|uniref:Putative transporter n=1 Tax=Colletotrichum spinosum TaxID=1347390 RepID=A0A4R8Q1P4_9PEZI|nr:putative transporter [Colletotrichum spinosum]